MWEADAQVVDANFHCSHVCFLLLCSAMAAKAKVKKTAAQRRAEWKLIEWSSDEEEEERQPSSVASVWTDWEAASGAWSLEDANLNNRKDHLRIERNGDCQYNLFFHRRNDIDIKVIRD